MKHNFITLFISLFVCSANAEISTGGYHYYQFIGNQGRGFGDTTYNQLSQNTLASLSGVKQIACGGFSTIFINEDDTVSALGEYTIPHTTPHGTKNPISVPTQVVGLSDIVKIAAGHRHFLALDSRGELYSWGANVSGALGDSGYQDSDVPRLILSDVADIAAGDAFSLAVTTSNTVFSWGLNDEGQLGHGDTQSRRVPAQIAGLSNVVSVEAGGKHSLFLFSNGRVSSCGNNDYGQLGQGSKTALLTPTLIPNLRNVTKLASGYHHNFSQNSDGDLYTWGRNLEGQCSLRRIVEGQFILSPVLVEFDFPIADFDCGYHYTIFEEDSLSLNAFGYDSDGLLGDVSAFPNATDQLVEIEADADNDQYLDIQELGFGTDPNDNGSFFVFEILDRETVSFPSQTGISYRVETSLDLNTWSFVRSIEGNGLTQQVAIPADLVTDNIERRFYRIQPTR